MKNELLVKLYGRLSEEDLKLVSETFDEVSYNYDIKVKETSLVVYDDTNIRLLKKYMVCMSISGKSDKTIKQYARSSKKFLEFIGKNVEDIDVDDVRLYMYELKKNGLSECSRDNERRNLSAFFSWLTKERVISSNPIDGVERVKFNNKVKVALTLDELNEVRNACKNTRERAVVDFLYSTGCRVGGFVEVKVTDVDFEKQEVILTEKGNKQRIVYLSDTCVESLKTYLDEYGTKENLFYSVSGNSYGKKLSVQGVENIFANIIKRTGVTATPHTLRDTVATHLLEAGVPIDQIQKILGHTDIGTTQIYAQTNMKMVKESHMSVIK